MQLFAGIDLGSSTTKAAVLTADGRLCGMGLAATASCYRRAASTALALATQELRRLLILRLSKRVASVRPSAQAKLQTLWLRTWQETLTEELMEQLRRSLAALTDSGQASAVRELLARSIEWLRCRWLHQEVPPYMLPFRTWQELRRRVLGELPSRAAAAADERATVASLVESLLSGLAVPAGDSERFADLFDLAVVDEYGSSWPLRRAVQEMLRTELVPCRTVVTGYGRRQFDSLGGEVCSEINCHARSACEQYPGTRMVLDIGGQDTKVIAVCDGGRVQKFWMNDRCAAGCGRYVAYVSEELGLSYEQLDELALGASRAVELSTTCTVFAGVELRERLALGGSPAELAAGLFSAVAKRALSLVGRAGGLRGELTFTGGMAAYRAAVRAVRQAVKERYGEWEVNVPADPIMAGALGAAGIARDRWLARERRAAS